jgi:8-amino-7-oxononanoate synthase
MEKLLSQREADGLLRILKVRSATEVRVNLADNDYLNLSHDSEVVAAAIAALNKWGASSSASPLVTGYTDLHQDLEKTLAQWHGYAHALILNTGFSANTAVLGGLPQKGDIVLADKLIHASMLEGILSSGATLRRFPHNDLDVLESMLEESKETDVPLFVVTESVYSMDGDCPDLSRISKLKQRYNFCWVLDEAHATGWHGQTGSGMQEEQGVRAAADIVVGTLGKSLGSQGAYVLCHDVLIKNMIINFAAEFIYSTYLSPASAAAGLAAITRTKNLVSERAQLQQLSRDWRKALREAGFTAPDCHSPIIPLIIGDIKKTQLYAEALRSAGFIVSVIRPPTVPVNSARIRISLRRGLNPGHLEKFISTLKGVAQ